MTVQFKGVLSEAQHPMKGDYPDVPLAEGVILAELTEGDDAPMFITLPIAFVATSRNQVNYAEKDVIRIVEAVNTRNVVGNLGHLPEWERPFTFAIPPLRWVGAIYNADTRTAWGKAYVLPTAGDVRDYIRASKGANAHIGTSIYGTAEIDNEGNIVGESLELENIDLAHPARLGMPMAARIPFITQETLNETSSPIVEETHMDPNAKNKPSEETQGLIVSETETQLRKTVSDLTTQLRELTTRQSEAEVRLKDLNQINDMLGKPADVVVALQAELAKGKDLANENLRLLESAISAEVAKKVMAESVRPTIEAMVKAQKPARYTDMLVVLESVLAQEHIKLLLKHTTSVTMGEAQQRPTVPQTDEGDIFIHIPKQ